LRRPDSWVASCVADLLGGADGSVFLKAPIGTASAGVLRADTPQQVRDAATDFERAGAFDAGGVLVERPIAGQLVMVQAVFDTGRLVALHANHRTREGVGGGACSKTSRATTDLTGDLTALGTFLGWHGALSLDAIDGADGPVWIDVNPRLVEPVNAARSGVDLIGPLLALAHGGPLPVLPVCGQTGIRTHQLLLAVLGAAQSGHGRLGVLREVAAAASRRGPYAASSEELTPLRHDPLAALPVMAASIGCLLRPAWHRAFTSTAVSNYALTPSGWRQLNAAAG
jgi:hypothetical protein